MRTLVVSDLHLGSRDAVDVLRRPAALDRLIAALDGVGRLVLLGDTIEMRHGPAVDSLALATPVLRRIGAALGSDAEVVAVPGNHDHALAAGWLSDGAPLGLDERCAPAQASRWAAEVAAALAPARVEIAYPGVWLRDDVWATHGHYLDAHTTMPSLERLLSGAMARAAGPVPRNGATVRHYEAVLAPIYAWAQSAAQHAAKGYAPAGDGRSARIWRLLNPPGGRRSLRGHAVAAALPVAVAVANAAGIGPVRARIDPVELRRSSLLAMGEVTRRLGVGARHVLFGHTHRTGPLPADDAAEWGTLVNAGSWVRNGDIEPRASSANPYWPGGAVVVEDHGPPVLRRLLDDVDAVALSSPIPA